MPGYPAAKQIFLMPVETGLIKKNLRDLSERTASLRGFL
jgi:hypothetical protein